MTKKMPKKAKWFIAIGILLNVLLVTGIYINYRLDKIVASLNRPGVLFSDTQSNETGAEGQIENAEKLSDGSYWNKSWDDETNGTGLPENGVDSSEDSNNSSNQIQNDIANKIGQPVDKSDMIKAGLIILKRLDSSEVAYVYNVGRKGKMSDDERLQMRKILLNKLTEDDIAALKSIAKKYGHELSILNK